MKINFHNPKTDKPSTVILPDNWLVLYAQAFEEREGWSSSHSHLSDVVRWLAASYYSGEPDIFLPHPGTSTFTHYCECYLSQRLCDYLEMKV